MFMFQNNFIFDLICPMKSIYYLSNNFVYEKISILNKFRYTFYAIKFKSKFKRWLWEKVREPKIMKQFHPDHLTALKETDDLEEFLEDWIK